MKISRYCPEFSIDFSWYDSLKFYAFQLVGLLHNFFPTRVLDFLSDFQDFQLKILGCNFSLIHYGVSYSS